LVGGCEAKNSGARKKLRETIRTQCDPVVEGSFIGTLHINAM
jgi:hypothetical protein